MGFATTALNSMLDSLTVNTAKLHNGDPGAVGTANELTGGTYASKAVTFGAASSGVRTKTGTATFGVPAGGSVQYVSFWNSGTFLWSDQVTTEAFAAAGTYALSASTMTLSNA